jgi:hypothetical protein
MLIIVVIGLIIVALMVYTSTRIKRVSAAAYEPETIETDGFGIGKPAGFLSVVDPKPPYSFQAYSKDFGTDEAENIHLATANVMISDASLDETVSAFGASGSELREVIDNVHYRVLELKTEEKGIDFVELVKLAERDGKVYTFTIKIIAETTDEFRRDIESMLDSFELK